MISFRRIWDGKVRLEWWDALEYNMILGAWLLVLVRGPGRWSLAQ